jgi:endonuclease-3 related protein
MERIATSLDLLLRLKSLGYDNPSRDSWWWPDSGTFLTAVSAILTQNVSWGNVETSLSNLRSHGITTPKSFAMIDPDALEHLIRPSGFFRNKTRNIIALSTHLLNDFGRFATFQSDVDRAWLLSQRGIGPESADAILNYACHREAFVVDSYTARLLDALGVEVDGYDAVQSWMLDGLEERAGGLFSGITLAQVFARSHGMVVEYCKTHKMGRTIAVQELCS